MSEIITDQTTLARFRGRASRWRADREIAVNNLDLFYGDFHALHGMNMDIPANKDHGVHWAVRLRKVNAAAHAQPHERLGRGCRIEGEVNLDGEKIYAKGTDVNGLRRRVGMVFQSPIRFR